MSATACFKPLSARVGNIIKASRFLAGAKELVSAARARARQFKDKTRHFKEVLQEPLHKALVISISYLGSALSRTPTFIGPAPPPPPIKTATITNPLSAAIARGADPVDDNSIPSIGVPEGTPISRGGNAVLLRANRDGDNLESRLRTRFGFRNVVRLADDGKHTLPTASNIIAAIKELHKGARSRSNLIFAFIGHGDQENTFDESEVDGKDERIVAVDGVRIRDNELHELLVTPLPCGARLTAIFDSCHSGTALDLPNSTEHPPILFRSRRICTYDSISRDKPFCYKTLFRSVSGRFGRQEQPEPGSDDQMPAIVISISACKDSQSAYEFKEGYSMTDIIVRIIDQEPGYLTIKILEDRLEHAYRKVNQAINKRTHLPEGWTGQNPQVSSNTELEDARAEYFIAMPLLAAPSTPTVVPSIIDSDETAVEA